MVNFLAPNERSHPQLSNEVIKLRWSYLEVPQISNSNFFKIVKILGCFLAFTWKIQIFSENFENKKSNVINV